ncbi:MAG: YybH family protein [Acidobacteriota bacterium]
MPGHRGCPLRAALTLAAAIGLAGCGAGPAKPAPLPATERARIRELNHRYTEAWLANDPDAVMRLFTADAVILPHHGAAPAAGTTEIMAFWWPPGTPPATVTQLLMSPDEIAGTGDLGYVRGRFSLTFTYEEGGAARTLGSSGNYLMIVRRGEDGVWRISRHIWNGPAPVAE